MASSTFSLIERIKRGESQAFSLLFEKYKRRLAVLAMLRIRPELRPRIEIDDVLQEVFTRTFHDMDRFNYSRPGDFMRWASTILDHVVADMVRFQQRQKRRAVEIVRFRSDSNPEGPEPLEERTPTRLLAEKERLDYLVAKLGELPEDYRNVIVLIKIECLSTDEAAGRLGKSRPATALLLHRALKRLRELCASNEAASDGR